MFLGFFFLLAHINCSQSTITAHGSAYHHYRTFTKLYWAAS